MRKPKIGYVCCHRDNILPLHKKTAEQYIKQDTLRGRGREHVWKLKKTPQEAAKGLVHSDMRVFLVVDWKMMWEIPIEKEEK